MLKIAPSLLAANYLKLGEEITRMADRVVRMRGGRMHEVTINRYPAHAADLVW